MANAKAYKATPGHPTATQKVGLGSSTLTSSMDSAFMELFRLGWQSSGVGPSFAVEDVQTGCRQREPLRDQKMNSVLLCCVLEQYIANVILRIN